MTKPHYSHSGKHINVSLGENLLPNWPDRRKEQQSKIKSLIVQIHKLEATHKRTIAAATLEELTNARTTLSEKLS